MCVFYHNFILIMEHLGNEFSTCKYNYTHVHTFVAGIKLSHNITVNICKIVAGCFYCCCYCFATTAGNNKGNKPKQYNSVVVVVVSRTCSLS